MSTILTRTTLSVFVALFVARPEVAAAAELFEGAASVRVVGGNLVSARRLALSAAKRDAAAVAIASVVGQERFDRLDDRVRESLVRKGASLVVTYRVLDEQVEDKRFALRLSVQFRLKALTSAVRTQLGDRPVDRTGGPISQPGRTLVALNVTCLGPSVGSHCAAVRQTVASAWRAAGYAAAVLASGQDDEIRARRAGAAWLVRLALTLRDGAPVRGIAWSTAACKGSVEAVSVGAGPTRPVAHQFELWRARSTAKQARRQALSAATRRANTWAVGALSRRRVSAPGGGRGVVIHLSGLSSYAGFARFERTLAESINGVSAVTLRRVMAGQAWWWVAFNGTTAALARALDGRTVGQGQVVKLISQAGRTVRLAMVARELNNGTTSPEP